MKILTTRKSSEAAIVNHLDPVPMSPATATISLDFESWDHKPSITLQYKDKRDKYGNPRTEARVLGSRLGIETADVTPETLTKAIVNGQTWSPFVFNTCPDWRRRRRIESLFAGCQILAVDYDYGDSADEIITLAKQVGIHFNILHHSFSSTPEHPKFRGIVFLDEKITDVDTAKILSTGFTHGLNGDRACIDTARMYYGSYPDSVIHMDNEILTPVQVVRDLADSVGADKYVYSRQHAPREHDPDWGTIEDQRKILNGLQKGKRAYVKRKILGILREIETFDGNEHDCTSRYECVWRKTSRIARMPETVGNVVYDWVMERIDNNSYFDDWDKDASAIVKNAISWSFEHSEPPV